MDVILVAVCSVRCAALTLGSWNRLVQVPFASCCDCSSNLVLCYCTILKRFLSCWEIELRTVITYGTFDLFHEGHRRLLERARELGDRLIVGVTTDTYDVSRGKLNVAQSVLERIENVRSTGLVDEIIVEEYDGQKVQDIQNLDVDVFAIGSDWMGKFDYLNDYCEVVYLDRTRGVSSTQIRNATTGIMRVGIVGDGDLARSLVAEARYVSGLSVEAIWSSDLEKAQMLADQLELAWVNDTYQDLLDHVEAVYISAPPNGESDLVERALRAGVHVLCEPPVSLEEGRTGELFELASSQGLVLIEAIRTAYAPAFQRMVAYARSGAIGTVRSVDVNFTRLLHGPEAVEAARQGSLQRMAAYPVLAVLKLLGKDYESLHSQVLQDRNGEVDLFAKLSFTYANALASVKVGFGVRAENTLEIAGSLGTLYVPAPWWETQHFETRFDDAKENQAFFVRFGGEGMRYELAELVTHVRNKGENSYKLSRSDSIAIDSAIAEAKSVATYFGRA